MTELCAAVLGIGWVTAAGPGQGRSAAPFHWQPGTLPALRRQDLFAEPDLRFGRLDGFSRLGLAGIVLALRDAGLEAWQEKRPFGLLASSRYGCLATDLAYFATVLPTGGGLPSPQLFAYTLPNCFLGEAAIRCGLTGPACVLSPAGDHGTAALTMSIEMLHWEEAPVMIAGCCDQSAPAAVESGNKEPAGAIFFVLAREPFENIGSLAEIRLCEGHLVCGGQPLASLAEAVTACRQQ
ncbi:MAG: beta-ketoacyl synthase N-terminal-like domain-containing protein [Desulfuromonadales bacterium]